MKKLLFKVGLLVGMMMLVPYYLLGSGTMPGFLQDLFKTEKKERVPLTNLSSVTTDKAITLYKCKSESGQIEYSQSPCEGDGETMHLQPNVNVVQRTKAPEEEEVSSEGGSVISLGGGGDDRKDGETTGTELGNPYDPENIQKLIKDAKNVGKLMEQHNKQLENVSGQQK